MRPTKLTDAEVNMRTKLLCLTTVFILAIGTSVFAEEPAPATKVANALNFLKPGNDYIIKFPETHNVFRYRRSGISEVKPKEGKPYASNWHVNLAVEAFTVKRPPQGSWVLLEHPEDPKYALAWNMKRIALAQLTDRRIKELELTEEGKTALALFREQAAEDIETTKTWVNLDHAIAISDIPDTLPPPEWSVNASVSSN